MASQIAGTWTSRRRWCLNVAMPPGCQSLDYVYRGFNHVQRSPLRMCSGSGLSGSGQEAPAWRGPEQARDRDDVPVLSSRRLSNCVGIGRFPSFPFSERDSMWHGCWYPKASIMTFDLLKEPKHEFINSCG